MGPRSCPPHRAAGLSRLVDSPANYYRLKIIFGRVIFCVPASCAWRPYAIEGGEIMQTLRRGTVVLAAVLFVTTAARAEIKVGFVTSLSGPAASIGIPYSKGIAAAVEYANTVNGEKINLIQLDDGSDPSTATRNARKLVEEDKVDVLIGTASAPSTIAMVAVANELKVPMIAISPISVPKVDDLWAIDVVQPTDLMSIVVADRMSRLGQKNVGFIGFSDAWGDLVY